MDRASDSPPLDLVRLIEVLDRHQVEYVIVGGVAATAYGAARETEDADCVVRRERSNLHRLASALRELNARLRVAGMTDHEARELPVQLDVMMLEKTGNSTWTTDAGSFDVLADLKDRVGHSVPYEDLITRSVILEGDGFNLHMASLDDIIAAKTFANRPKDLEVLPDLLSIQNRDSGLSPPTDTPGHGPQPGL